jgi:uncharacterized alkaline shock family protein YloU
MTEKSSPLRSDRGTTTVADSVVTVVAGTAAKEVEGVTMASGGRRMPGDNSPTVGEFLSGFGARGESASRGVFVAVEDGEATVDLHVNVEYGRPVPKVVEALRKNVTERVEGPTGVRVAEANVTVSDVTFPEGVQG